MFRVDWAKTSLLATLLAVEGGFTLALIWAVGQIGVSLVESGEDRSALWFWLLAIALLQAIKPLISVGVRWLCIVIGRTLERAVRERVMQAAGAPGGIGHLETEAQAGLLAAASGSAVKTFSSLHIVQSSAAWAGTRVQGFAAVSALFVYAPWAPFVLWAAWSLFPSWLDRQTQAQVAANEASTLGLRRADYVRGIALAPEAAKEIRLFGLAGWLSQRFSADRSGGLHEATQTRHRGRWGFIPLLVLPAIAMSGLGYGMIEAFRAGSFAFVYLVMGMTALIGSVEMGRTMAWWTRSWHGVDVLNALDRLAAMKSLGGTIHAGARVPHELPRKGITFSSLFFAYPGQSKSVYDGLDCFIPAGSSCAIVGANGVGKTTLVKLLARMYEPVSGSIRIDDVDLRDYVLADWRRQLAVVSQDFVKYPATLRENVWPGLPAPTPQQWTRVCARAGLDVLVAQLPAGADTLLARGYTGATDLSGGQWQRVALARALAAVERGAKVLVLDEPTANLDIRAEAELFAQFVELTRGLTTILITHRMASVQHVDQVFVLEEGRVVETGNPRTLLSQGGRYADLFRLQAERFIQEGDHG